MSNVAEAAVLQEKQETSQEAAFQTDKTTFGFWVYLMTDLVLFSTLFATFAVLRTATAGGPALGTLFDPPYVLVETLLLLTSSFTCGLAIVAAKQGNSAQVRRLVLLGLGATFLLGLGFLGMELHEFRNLASEGHSWRSSGALSSFFTLVATHGAHITAGLIWITVMMVTIWKQGLTPNHVRRLTLLSLFWHFLDVVWIFIFTFVYLLGAAS
jgi:cytochrome o ubiquinol oxidase subunit 3